MPDILLQIWPLSVNMFRSRSLYRTYLHKPWIVIDDQCSELGEKAGLVDWPFWEINKGLLRFGKWEFGQNLDSLWVKLYSIFSNQVAAEAN